MAPIFRLLLLLWTAIALVAENRDGYVPVPGASLHFRDSGGNGVVVVFLHAATGTSDSWEYQTPAFTAAGFRVVAYDRRGWGKTKVEPRGPAGTAASDLLALADHLGLARFHLVGTAAGGFVAFDFAASYPERLRSLVIANSMGGLQDQEVVELQRRLRPKEFAALPPDFRELGPAYRAGNPEGTRRWVQHEQVSRPEGPRPPAQPFANRLSYALLDQIETPVLLLTGGADLYAPPPLQNLFAKHLRNARTVVIPEAGHSAYWETPEVFNRTVLEFLRTR